MKNRLMTPAKAAAAVSLAFLTAVAATSCLRDPIVYPTGNYYQAISFDESVKDLPSESELSRVWTASYYGEDDKLSYNMYLKPYNHPEGFPYGGYVSGLEAGRKSVLLYNFDVSTLRYDMTQSYDKAYAYTELADRINGTPVIYAPDRLFVWSGQENIPFVTEDDGTYIIQSNVRELTQNWKVIVKGIRNAQNIESIAFFLSGQRRACFLGKDEPIDEKAILFFGGSVAATETQKDGTLTGDVTADFATFGFLPSAETTLLTVRVIGLSTFQYYIQEDVTDYMLDPESCNYTIIIDGSSIDVEQRKDGGFNPQAEKWDEEVSHIVLE